jgi:hypothetical protein
MAHWRTQWQTDEAMVSRSCALRPLRLASMSPLGPQTEVPLPQLRVSARVVSAELELPTTATVGALTALSVSVKNHSEALQARAPPRCAPTGRLRCALLISNRAPNLRAANSRRPPPRGTPRR